MIWMIYNNPNKKGWPAVKPISSIYTEANWAAMFQKWLQKHSEVIPVFDVFQKLPKGMHANDVLIERVKGDIEHCYKPAVLKMYKVLDDFCRNTSTNFLLAKLDNIVKKMRRRKKPAYMYKDIKESELITDEDLVGLMDYALVRMLFNEVLFDYQCAVKFIRKLHYEKNFRKRNKVGKEHPYYLPRHLVKMALNQVSIEQRKDPKVFEKVFGEALINVKKDHSEKTKELRQKQKNYSIRMKALTVIPTQEVASLVILKKEQSLPLALIKITP